LSVSASSAIAAFCTPFRAWSIGKAATGPSRVLAVLWRTGRDVYKALVIFMGAWFVDSRRLSLRKIQPGHVRTFTKSEDAFHAVATTFQDIEGITVERQPTSLSRFYVAEGETHRFGLRPEEEILHVPSGRRLFFEVKNQGPRGNAEERAYRHHTIEFQTRLMALFRLDYHPYFTIFTGNLATDDRYTLKFRYHIEAGHYFLWTDYTTQAGWDALHEYLAGLIERYLLRSERAV